MSQSNAVLKIVPMSDDVKDSFIRLREANAEKRKAAELARQEQGYKIGQLTRYYQDENKIGVRNDYLSYTSSIVIAHALHSAGLIQIGKNPQDELIYRQLDPTGKALPQITMWPGATLEMLVRQYCKDNQIDQKGEPTA